MEFVQFSELLKDENDLEKERILGPTGDFSESTLGLQWSIVTDYLGYKLTMQTGFKLTRRSVETIEGIDLDIKKETETETTSATFITVYAGVEQ